MSAVLFSCVDVFPVEAGSLGGQIEDRVLSESNWTKNGVVQNDVIIFNAYIH